MLPEKLGQNLKETNKQIMTQSFGLISSAFVLVAALAWNDLIKDLITSYLKIGTGLISRFIYAIIITITPALVALHFNKLSQKVSGSDSAGQN